VKRRGKRVSLSMARASLSHYADLVEGDDVDFLVLTRHGRPSVAVVRCSSTGWPRLPCPELVAEEVLERIGEGLRDTFEQAVGGPE